jgi:hypothetical protein
LDLNQDFDFSICALNQQAILPLNDHLMKTNGHSKAEFFFSLLYWSLNSGPHTYQAGAQSLELLYQS